MSLEQLYDDMRVFFVFLLSIISTLGRAQCTDIFIDWTLSDIKVTNNVAYGASTTFSGSNQNLTMDIYEPDDTVSAHPLIIWVHGGSFLTGSKNDGDMEGFCDHFSHRGYVCATINYRLGFNILGEDEEEMLKAVIRAVQDARAAVRFFRKNAAIYKVDTNQIFIGGTSAGAITALHVGYLDQLSECDAKLAAAVNTVGGLEGSSGNEGFSSKVHGVISYAGALGDVNYMNNNTDVFVFSMHATGDAVVPYFRAPFLNPFTNTTIRNLDGSEPIHIKANELNIPNRLFRYDGAPHPVHDLSGYFDTTIHFTAPLLFTQLDCYDGPDLELLSVGLKESNHKGNIVIFPNPASSFVKINHHDSNQLTYQIMDMQGKSIKKGVFVDRIKIENLEKGIYILSIPEWQENQKLIIQ